jgi:hypothetical protein
MIGIAKVSSAAKGKGKGKGKAPAKPQVQTSLKSKSDPFTPPDHGSAFQGGAAGPIGGDLDLLPGARNWILKELGTKYICARRALDLELEEKKTTKY